jgi:hypothetical protein
VVQRAALKPAPNGAKLPKLQVDDRGIEGFCKALRSAAPYGAANRPRLGSLGINQHLGPAAFSSPPNLADEMAAFATLESIGHHNEVWHAHSAYSHSLAGILDKCELEAITFEKTDELKAIILLARYNQALKHILHFPQAAQSFR